jgi:hypothetical protein
MKINEVTTALGNESRYADLLRDFCKHVPLPPNLGYRYETSYLAECPVLTVYEENGESFDEVRARQLLARLRDIVDACSLPFRVGSCYVLVSPGSITYRLEVLADPDSLLELHIHGVRAHTTQTDGFVPFNLNQLKEE